MRSIDIHAHTAPAKALCLEVGKEWHGFTRIEESGRHFLVRVPLLPTYVAAGAALFLWGIATTLI